MTSKDETIAVVRSGTGMDFNRYVDRVFRSDDAAFKWLNRQSRNHIVLRLPGRYSVGDVIAPSVKTTNIEARYITNEEQL